MSVQLTHPTVAGEVGFGAAFFMLSEDEVGIWVERLDGSAHCRVRYPWSSVFEVRYV
jgi:hypothetical protein